jgi:hypothetical protein
MMKQKNIDNHNSPSSLYLYQETIFQLLLEEEKNLILASNGKKYAYQLREAVFQRDLIGEIKKKVELSNINGFTPMEKNETKRYVTQTNFFLTLFQTIVLHSITQLKNDFKEAPGPLMINMNASFGDVFEWCRQNYANIMSANEDLTFYVHEINRLREEVAANPNIPLCHLYVMIYFFELMKRKYQFTDQIAKRSALDELLKKEKVINEGLSRLEIYLRLEKELYLAASKYNFKLKRSDKKADSNDFYINYIKENNGFFRKQIESVLITWPKISTTFCQYFLFPSLSIIKVVEARRLALQSYKNTKNPNALKYWYNQEIIYNTLDERTEKVLLKIVTINFLDKFEVGISEKKERKEMVDRVSEQMIEQSGLDHLEFRWITYLGKIHQKARDDSYIYDIVYEAMFLDSRRSWIDKDSGKKITMDARYEIDSYAVRSVLTYLFHFLYFQPEKFGLTLSFEKTSALYIQVVKELACLTHLDEESMVNYTANFWYYKNVRPNNYLLERRDVRKNLMDVYEFRLDIGNKYLNVVIRKNLLGYLTELALFRVHELDSNFLGLVQAEGWESYRSAEEDCHVKFFLFQVDLYYEFATQQEQKFSLDRMLELTRFKGLLFQDPEYFHFTTEKALQEFGKDYIFFASKHLFSAYQRYFGFGFGLNVTKEVLKSWFADKGYRNYYHFSQVNGVSFDFLGLIHLYVYYPNYFWNLIEYFETSYGSRIKNMSHSELKANVFNLRNIFGTNAPSFPSDPAVFKNSSYVENMVHLYKKQMQLVKQVNQYLLSCAEILMRFELIVGSKKEVEFFRRELDLLMRANKRFQIWHETLENNFSGTRRPKIFLREQLISERPLIRFYYPNEGLITDHPNQKVQINTSWIFGSVQLNVMISILNEMEEFIWSFTSRFLEDYEKRTNWPPLKN